MQLTPQNTQDGLIAGVIIVALLLAGFLGSRRRRYVIDEHGERQRVIAWNRGQPVYDPKTWQQRIFEEVTVRKERRKWLLVSTPLTLGPILLYGYAVAHDDLLLAWLGGIGLITMALPAGLAYFLPCLFKELAYQFGYQGMQGAKVLDRQPTVRPGREVVETQKAHGDARLASESEALSALNSRK